MDLGLVSEEEPRHQPPVRRTVGTLGHRLAHPMAKWLSGENVSDFQLGTRCGEEGFPLLSSASQLSEV